MSHWIFDLNRDGVDIAPFGALDHTLATLAAGRRVVRLLIDRRLVPLARSLATVEIVNHAATDTIPVSFSVASPSVRRTRARVVTDRLRA
jgi:hypothetical protein